MGGRPKHPTFAFCRLQKLVAWSLVVAVSISQHTENAAAVPSTLPPCPLKSSLLLSAIPLLAAMSASHGGLNGGFELTA